MEHGVVLRPQVRRLKSLRNGDAYLQIRSVVGKSHLAFLAFRVGRRHHEVILELVSASKLTLAGGAAMVWVFFGPVLQRIQAR